jgi:hypothetical protein
MNVGRDADALERRLMPDQARVRITSPGMPVEPG